MAYLKRGDEIPKKGKGSKISEKMLRFVDEYMLDMNASQAVLRVGYKTVTPNRLGTELLRHPLVSAEIKARMDKKREANEITADYLQNKLVAIIEATETNNPQAALRGIELAGKIIALWRDRQEISGPDGKAIEMEQKVKEDVADFRSQLARIAHRGGKGKVSQFPDPGSSSEA